MAVVTLAVVDAAAAQETKTIGLRAAIAEALTSSPRLSAPEDAMTLAQIHQRQQAARFATKLVPTLDAGTNPGGFDQRTIGLGVSRKLPFGTDVQASVTSIQYGTGSAAFQDAGYSIGISQPLLRGLVDPRFDADQARRGVDTARHARVDARQQLVVSAAATYLDVLRARQLVENAERAAERSSLLHAASEARAKVGLDTELDVMRATLLQSQAASSLSEDRERLDSALDALKALLGRDLNSDIDVEDVDLSDESLTALGLAPTPEGELQPGGDADVNRLVSTALAHRTDVQESRDRITDARRAEKVARWNLLPPLTLNVGYTRRGIGSPGDVFGSLMTGWRFGISSSYALDHADEQAAAAAAAVSVRAAERSSADTDRAATTEVRQAWRAWRRTADVIAIQQTTVDLEERQARVAHLRYERGLAGNFDVIDAENNLYQAQSGLIAARVNRALAGLALRRAAGLLNPDAFRP